MRECRAHSNQMERRGRKCCWCAPFLRRGACRGLYQSVVRIGVRSAKAWLFGNL